MIAFHSLFILLVMGVAHSHRFHTEITHMKPSTTENSTKVASNDTMTPKNASSMAMVVVFSPRNTTTRNESSILGPSEQSKLAKAKQDKPGQEKPEHGKPDSSKPEMKSETGKPETGKSGETKTEMGKSGDVNKTEAGKSEQAKSGKESEFCQTTVTTAINDFSYDLWDRLKKDGNLLISPLSISIALAMAYHGAGGNTAKQLGETLMYHHEELKQSNVTDDIWESAGPNDNYTLLLGNGMFVLKKYALESKFQKEMEEIYKARVDNLDFGEDGKSAVSEINSWVASSTKNNVAKMVEGPLDSNTKAVLMNAAYFKGQWKYEFPLNETKEESFYKLDNTTKKVKIMSLQGKKFLFKNCNETQHKFLELPYMGDTITMLLALPNNVTSAPDLDMTSQRLCQVYSHMKMTELREVALPKFKMEHKSDIKDPLTALGITDLFASSANLTAISKVEGMFVNSAIHKVVVEVAEEGGKSSNITEDTMTSTGTKPTSDPEPTSFVANHPFLFHIVDKRNGLVLISGRVTDPSSS